MTEGPPAQPPEEPICPRCGAPTTPEQEYCLECGLRLSGGGGVVRSLESSWRRRVGRYPGDWMWPVLLGLVIAVAGATAAILIGASDDNGGSTLVATTGGTAHVPSTPPATATATLPTVPAGTPTTTAPTVPTTPPPATTTARPPSSGGLTAWPAGRNGFTVVLESIPTTAGRAFAVARARAAARSGIPSVGVLNSGSFSSLHPGYFVVFSGVYSSQAAADQGRVTAAGKGYPAAYAREIRR
jgi:hypothetical protein